MNHEPMIYQLRAHWHKIIEGALNLQDFTKIFLIDMSILQAAYHVPLASPDDILDEIEILVEPEKQDQPKGVPKIDTAPKKLLKLVFKKTKLNQNEQNMIRNYYHYPTKNAPQQFQLREVVEQMMPQDFKNSGILAVMIFLSPWMELGW